MAADILAILDAMAKERAEKDGTAYHEAYEAVLIEHPDLYGQYVAAAKGEQAGIPDPSPVPRNAWYDELAKRGFWMDAQVFFLGRVLDISDPQVTLNLWEIVKLDDPVRHEALRSWALRLNLTAEWCAQKAYEVVKPPSYTAPPRFRFETEGWNPYFGSGVTVEMEMETGFRHLLSSGRVDTEQRIRAEFNLKLSNHFRDMEAEARGRGWLDPAEKRNMAHFRWAARFQVGGEEYADIAKTVGVTTQNVGQEVRAVLERIKLTSRPLASQGGRPSKEKPQS